jgi:hypothetical protein
MLTSSFRILLFIGFVALNISCNKVEKRFSIQPKSKTGINFFNSLTDSPELNILKYLYYYNGAGVASGDFNNDGLEDLYFVSNQISNKLYLNKGAFKFQDITTGDLIDNEGWSTGVTTVDINHDGLLDIYICKVGNYGILKGKNKLLINKGIDKNGIPSFKDEANNYNLDISSFSTQTVFFDFDLDGDLDMFLLNHSVHPNGNYGRGNLRCKIDSLSGDRLYKNEGGNFVDVSISSKIYQGKIGYGLGVTASDVNNDGYPDLYVSNDFFENDYLYINQKDNTFKEVISNNKNQLGHTSHFSMGNDIADFNNDGLTDIISVDMLPENIETYKASGTEHPYQSYKQYLMNGYAPQYMQNTLQLNLGKDNFSEIAFVSGIAATEWSWSSLFADFDNDGYKDVYITNGIVGVTNDMDFISFIANENIQKRINQGMTSKDLSLIDDLPEKKVENYIFKNNGDLTFTDVSEKWMNNKPSFSNGSVYVDLDNDGDLDLVTNNINEEAFVHENHSNTFENLNNFLKVKFKGEDQNKFGIGAKVKVFTDSRSILQENYTTRGYLSAVSPHITIGIGKSNKIDSLVVIWPKGNYQTLKNVKINSALVLNEIDSKGNYYRETIKFNKKEFLIDTTLKINYKHKDNSFVEFTRDPLIPYMNTYQGPDISVDDVNNDGLQDVFLSGAKTQPSQLFLQKLDGTFTSSNEDIFEEDKLNEDVKHLFLDVDNDLDKDLIVVSGGNEFKNGKPLQPRLYINESGTFTQNHNAFSNIELNASVIIADDIDDDGDLDLFIGSNSVPHYFGKTPINYIFKNDGKGHFTPNTIDDLGLVQDAVFVDINNDSRKDLIVAGYWMPITILLNTENGFINDNNQSLSLTNGLWNCIKVEDFDNDGDGDILVGNWGLNTRLKASKEEPITLYLYDFDNNGFIDPVMSYYHQNKEVAFSTKEELTKQMPFLNKKYLSYKEFAKADFKELFSSNKLDQSEKKKIVTLETTYFENLGNNKFSKVKLPLLLQISSVHALYIEDFDNNGFKDVLLSGNRYDVNTQLGQLDASHGQLLLNFNGQFQLDKTNSFNLTGPVRAIKKITIKNEDHYLIGINNDSLQILKKPHK